MVLASYFRDKFLIPQREKYREHGRDQDRKEMAARWQEFPDASAKLQRMPGTAHLTTSWKFNTSTGEAPAGAPAAARTTER